jgi:hypothetical protein
MATSPAYAATPRGVGVLTTGTACVDLLSPTAASFATLLTPGASGSKVEEIDVVQAPATFTSVAASVCLVWFYNGSTYFLCDAFAMATVTPSATVAPTRVSRAYNNLIVPSGSTLVVANSTTGVLAVTAFGGDF